MSFKDVRSALAIAHADGFLDDEEVLFFTITTCLLIHFAMVGRRGSRENVDRFTAKQAPKMQAPREVRGHAPPGIFFNFNYLKYPFLAC